MNTLYFHERVLFWIKQKIDSKFFISVVPSNKWLFLGLPKGISVPPKQFVESLPPFSKSTQFYASKGRIRQNIPRLFH